MKNTLKISSCLALIFISLLFVGACKKDKESSQNFLTAADWSLTSSVASPGYVVGSDTITDLYAGMDSCEKDNILRFFTDDIVSIDAGVVKCDSLEPQGTQGYWKLIDSDTRIVYFNDTINLIDVNAEKLTVSFVVDSIPSSVQTVTNTYKNIK